ncbi:transcriptional regulator, propionate catabolism operon regulatory protein [Variovorax sp. YR266]|uniref:propionate catabolism operon regulatory protein PrpR n=1 Tax=Variovorax sp. YR266 TaxID=1884386 RepID=UPI00089704A5|nr:propionate catabolism operon regulatory protein PrpR [Variovorax sp. YR266]SDZ04768.1 transcriptional regulator, propionate catabolism operon regulatory protein [Variovorax sp. YR266]
MNALVLPPAHSSAAPRRPRIVAVARHRLGRVLVRLVPEVAAQAQIELVGLAFDEAVEAVRELHARAPVDAVVAAGASGEWLRQHLDIPVAMVEVRGFDLMRALAAARALSPRVGLVSFDAPSEHLAQLDALFGMGIAQFSYRGADDAPACVEALRAAGVQAVVAPGLVSDLAEQAGIASVLMYSDDAVRQALQDAIHLARHSLAERARHERLNTVLGQLQDGVVAVDLQQRIEALNPVMAELLGASVQELAGRVLGEVEPVLDLGATLRLREAPAEEVLQIGMRTLVVRRAPVMEGGEVTGALLVCRDPAVIQRADRHLRANQRQRGAPTRYRLEAFTGNSPLAQRVRELAAQCASSEATVLIVGESGTGKELVAQGIHTASRRATQPFLAVNCAALGESLLESELFGYEEGAFTGARRGGKTGLVEAAHTGTLFLDEIGDMPLALQTRLLRVLQEREVLRLGATAAVPVDLRVIAATHADLASQVERGLFRRDLYYRLAVLRIEMPPLRDREADIALLAAELMARRAGRAGVLAAQASAWLAALLELAAGYGWPGNVRELENLIERLLACHSYLAPAGNLDRARLLEVFPECTQARPAPVRERLLKGARRAAELRRVREVLQSVQGDQAKACAVLGISRATLWRRLRDEESATDAGPTPKKTRA